MKLTRRGFLAGAGAVAVGSAAWGLDPNRAWADEEAAEEAAGTDEAPAEEPAAPAGPVVVCEECPGACTLVLDVEDGRVAAVHGDGANPFSEGRLCLRAQALTDLWKAPEGTTEDDADDDSGNGAGGNDAASEGATTTSPGRLTSPRVRRAGSDAWEDISWDRALDEIANLVKDTRDATFEESIEGTEADDETQGETGFDEWDWSDRGGYGDDGYGDNDYSARKRPRGVPVMRTRAIGSFGGARLVAEEQFLLAKALRSWGVVNIDSEAAFGRRAFAAGVAATLGIAEPDGLWSDIANTDCLLTLGADVATSQPLSLRWIERARDAGALWIVVDPLRSASAEMADIHVPIRPGTDIAFLGGLAKYAMDNSLWQPEYVLNFTNASYLMDPAFSFDASSGAFFGWDPMTGTYDKTSWGYQTDGFDTWNMRFDGEFSWVRGEGVPAWAVPSQPRCERNITLQDPACAWVRLQEFLARYDLDTVATVCGVERSLLERAYGAFAATGAVEGAGKVLAGPGLVQHGTGAQAARAAAVVQLLLGNIGVPGGGISYLGGTANEGLAAAAKMPGAAGDDGAVDAAVADALAPDYSSMQADRAAYPIAAVINGSDGRDGARRALSETLAAAEPGCFVEMSASLARIRGLATGEWVRVFNERGSVEAPVLVTDRIRPFQCEDNEGHYVCLNGMTLGDEGAAAAVWGVLAPAAESPVGAARDVKGFLVDIEKA